MMADISLRSGRVYFDGDSIEIPNIVFHRRLGKGAHGVVFEATDHNLDRTVAVKIWNSKIGDWANSRARAEISKLGKQNHPSIVTVFSFDAWKGIPYAVMEFVAGHNATSWLSSNPALRDRYDVWAQVSSALKHVYDSKSTHGDPHTGNIIVNSSPSRKFSSFDSDIGVKLVDMGTSLLWDSPEALRQRERTVLIETAERLFKEVSPRDLLSLSDVKTHSHMLYVLSAFSRYCVGVGTDDLDVMSLYAAHSIRFVPYFDLLAVYHHLVGIRYPNRTQLFKQIAKSLGLDADDDWTDEQIQNTIATLQERYLRTRREMSQFRLTFD